MLREYYVKHGKLEIIDEMELTHTFLSLFFKGHIIDNCFYINHRAAECMLYSFYVELIKIKRNLVLKPTILNILAVNGSQESEVYRLIVNDKITRGKQEKLEKNIKRLRKQMVIN